MYIKDFDRFMFLKQKIKTKNTFEKAVYSVLVVKLYWQNTKKLFNKNSVRLEKGIIEFKNYFIQIPVPFKIYVDFDCKLKSVESYEGSYSKKVSRSRSFQFCLETCLCWW